MTKYDKKCDTCKRQVRDEYTVACIAGRICMECIAVFCLTGGDKSKSNRPVVDDSDEEVIRVRETIHELRLEGPFYVGDLISISRKSKRT